MPVLHIELAGYSRLLRITPENRSVATANLANLSYRAKEMRMQFEDKDENEGAQASVFLFVWLLFRAWFLFPIACLTNEHKKWSIR